MQIIEKWLCGCRVIEDKEGYRYRDRICNLGNFSNPKRNDFMFIEYNKKVIK